MDAHSGSSASGNGSEIPAERPDPLREALEAWFLALDRGEKPDEHALCGGDPKLVERFRRVLGGAGGVDRFAEAAGGSRPDVSRTGPATEPDAPVPDDPSDEAPPPRIPGYEILTPLGAGGMGQVWLARERALGRLVAIKVLKAQLDAGAAASLRFRREAEIAAALEHPGIVPVYAFGEVQQRPYLVMKWLAGPDLASLEAPLPPREAARIGLVVARALQAAHEAGIIHRDIKPANIILDGEAPYVADFGLSRSIASVTLTQQGSVPGTLTYMAPEQIEGRAPALDPRCDLYSWGATIYETIAGRPPFEADTQEALIRQILVLPPAPLRLGGAGRDLETIVFRALEKDPARRFPTAAALADDLERWLDGRPIRSRRVGPLERFGRLVARNRRVSAVIGAAALLALASLVLFGLERARLSGQKDRDLAAIDDAVTKLDLGLATRRFEDLRDRYGADDRDVANAKAATNRLAVLEELFDQVQDRPEDQNPEVLERVVNEVRVTGALDLAKRQGRLALALASLQQGRAGEVAAMLEEIEMHHGGPGRATAAIRAAAAGRTEVVWPEAPVPDAEEHVFASLALAFTGADRELREREIRAAIARREVRGHYRAQYAYAIFLIGSKQYREARDILDALPPDAHAPRGVQLFRAATSLRLGDASRAQSEIEAVPFEERSPRLLILEATIATMDDDEARAERLFERANEFGARDPQTQLTLGGLRIKQRRLAEARQHLEAARDLAIPRSLKELARAWMIEADVIACPEPQDESDPRAKELRAHLENAIRARAEFGDSFARAITCMSEVEARRRLVRADGRLDGALLRRLSAEAAALAPSWHVPLQRLIVLDREMAPAEERPRLILGHVEALWELYRRGCWPVSAAARCSLLVLGADCARRADDSARCLALIAAARSASPSAEQEAKLDQLALWAKQ